MSNSRHAVAPNEAVLPTDCPGIGPLPELIGEKDLLSRAAFRNFKTPVTEPAEGIDQLRAWEHHVRVEAYAIVASKPCIRKPIVLLPNDQLTDVALCDSR